MRIGRKTHQVVRGDVGVVRHDFSSGEAMERVLADDEALHLARLALRVETHYGGEPQDVEWAIAAGETFLVQSRAITALTAVDQPPTVAAGRPLLQGLAASPGIATGVVRILTPPSAGQELQRGEVLVGPMTSPDWVPTIRRAAALVTDGGGVTGHAAIVARELRIPCVVGTRTATSTVHDGEVVTVDGARGLVFEGVVAVPVVATASPAATGAPSESTTALATRLDVNLAIAEHCRPRPASSGSAVNASLLILEPGIGRLGARRLTGCLSDLRVNLVRARVVDVNSEPSASRP